MTSRITEVLDLLFVLYLSPFMPDNSETIFLHVVYKYE